VRLARLDGEERRAQERVTVAVTADLARFYLANPAELWNDTPPEGRRAIAEATFDRVEAVGLDIVIHPSAEAER
jgi:hypothetical protein